MANIGIINFWGTSSTGGTSQYAVTLIEALKQYSQHKYFIFYSDPGLIKLISEAENCRFIFLPIEKRSLDKAYMYAALITGIKSYFIDKAKIIKGFDLQLMIDLCFSPISYHSGIPYINVIYDLMHRYYRGLPEYGWLECIRRDILYRRSCVNSVFCVVDSNMSRNDLSAFYNVIREKVRVVPYYPAEYVYKYKDIQVTDVQQVINKYNLPEEFIFYPAQFWQHKNHLRLLEAVSLIKERYGIKINVVFVGSARKESLNTFLNVGNAIKRLNLGQQIFCLGYVADKEMVALYKRSAALVYPSLIGPTNIPILEAMFLGVPVVCSNLFSMPEQVGDAGVLFDPFNINDMAEKIRMVYSDNQIKSSLSKAGLQRVKDMTLQNYAQEWGKIINQALQNKNM